MRSKGAAGASEGIAAENAGVKQTQQQDASKQLQGMYGTDTSGMLDASKIQTGDINAMTNANQTGWLQNTTAIMNALKIGGSGGGGGPATWSVGGG
jgi:hypothetical protein